MDGWKECVTAVIDILGTDALRDPISTEKFCKALYVQDVQSIADSMNRICGALEVKNVK